MNSQSEYRVKSWSVSDVWQRLLMLGFGLLYNQMAWSYDLVSWLVSRGQWRSWQEAALPYLRGPDILELAHGPGHMLLALEAAGYEAVGLDLSPYMSRLAKRKVEKSGKSIALVRGDGRMLPFCQHSFDSILSTFPTEFLAEQETIDGLYSVLKPGGRLVIVPQAQLTDDSVTDRFIEWLYTITGQRPQVKNARENGIWQTIANQFRASGFELAFEQVRLESSKVTIVVAERSD